MPFAVHSAPGAIGATLNPNNPTITGQGISERIRLQAWVGVISNTLGEFAPDVKKKFSKHKSKD